MSHAESSRVRLCAAVLVANVAILSLAGPSAAEMRVFVQVPGIPGDALEDGFRQQIDAASFSWGVTPATDDATASLDTFVIEKQLDSASIPLAFAALAGTRFPNVVVTIATTSSGGMRPTAIFKLSGAAVSAVQLAGSAAEGVTMEHVVLSFARIEATYFPVDASGKPTRPVTKAWDLKNNVKA